MEFSHISVLLNETIDGLNIKPDGLYVDGTMGGAGHTREIAKRLTTGRVIGVDQDPDAIRNAKEMGIEDDGRICVVENNFKNIKIVLKRLGIEKIDGMILDLGVSSHQFDTTDRGFSYMYDAKLDMRMSQSGLSAWDIVNTYEESRLADVIFQYGEERYARRIARRIVERRQEATIDSTLALVEVIRSAMPGQALRSKIHPARRTFQALRIEVNNELGLLRQALENIVDVLKPGGRICVITFHSLEDRIVKETFKYMQQDCICPKEFPVCKCDKQQEVKIITRKPIIPSDAEIEGNRRSRSAKLRVAEKMEVEK
ncbi:16S rRNA (cytosine(1402)-N(4))-methyltransferase RsmH [Gottschalkiaceae bacterium SANA]|nr:16S rRNA (cytosine(1402)-N(4))-methyltransferase RsmH [Gottschalkiaceae bacterium SANA]